MRKAKIMLIIVYMAKESRKLCLHEILLCYNLRNNPIEMMGPVLI